MEVDKHTVEKMAHLSRLYFNSGDEGKILKSMNDILTWVDKLKEVDTEGVEPLTHMTFEQNIMREDGQKTTLTREKGLANAPKTDGEFFRVPKVID